MGFSSEKVNVGRKVRALDFFFLSIVVLMR